MMHSLELFVDLMIGYAYIKLKSYKKASAIIYKIIKLAKAKGMNAIEHIAWYVMSILNISEGRFDIAYGVLNNSNIQMEKTGAISEYLVMLNKVNMYIVLMCQKSQDQAQICMNQASSIIQKYGINFNLNIDIKKILLENSNTNRVDNQTLNTTSSVGKSESIERFSGFDESDGDVVNPMEFFSE
jgi:ATP/maltotriose-dependent transcriptional regulator MalT